jgi:hypothetical protein
MGSICQPRRFKYSQKDNLPGYSMDLTDETILQFCDLQIF